MTKTLDEQHKRDIAQKDIIILYDADCSDGFGSAWAAYRKFGDSAAYISVSHQTSPQKGLKNKTVYMLDFTYPEPITRQLIKDNILVTAIDHHKTVESATKLTENYSYSTRNSGAVLTWRYFHGSKKVPRILKIIEDNDIHKFTIPHSKELFEYITSFDFDFNIWTDLAKKFEDKAHLRQMTKDGNLVLQHEKRLVSWIIRSTMHFVKFQGHKVPLVNSFLFHADIADELLKQFPPIGLVWWTHNGIVFVSIHSDGSVDVSELAKRYGGGGHKNASGFSVPFKAELPWKQVKE